MDTVVNALDHMDVFMNALGIDAMMGVGIGLQLAATIQSVFIMFWVAAPLMGLMLARTGEKKSNMMIAWGIGVLVMLIGTFGIAYFLRQIIPEAILPGGLFSLLMGLAGIAAGVLVGRYLVWYLAEPGEPLWAREFREEVAQNATALERSHRQYRKEHQGERQTEQRAERARKSIYNRKRP